MKNKAKEVVEKMLENALKELEKDTTPSKETLEMVQIALSYTFCDFEAKVNFHSIAESVEKALQEPFEP